MRKIQIVSCLTLNFIGLFAFAVPRPEVSGKDLLANKTWNYEDAIAVRGVENSTGSLERYATVSLMASWMPNLDWTAALTYSDQTWLGSPNNTTLSQTAILSLQKRWAR